MYNVGEVLDYRPAAKGTRIGFLDVELPDLGFRGLTDPVSISRGIGPECAGTSSNAVPGLFVECAEVSGEQP